MSHKSLRRRGHSVSGLFLFLLIGLFAILSFTLVLAGIQVYRQVTLQAGLNTDKQLALSYLNNKVRAYDGSESVFVDTRKGVNLLCLREELEGQAYETLIYEYEGAMCEQFAVAGESFDPNRGERLTRVNAVRFVQEESNLLRVDVTLPDGSEHTLHMALRSEQAG